MSVRCVLAGLGRGTEHSRQKEEQEARPRGMKGKAYQGNRCWFDGADTWGIRED